MPERNFNFFLSKGSFIALLSVVACQHFVVVTLDVHRGSPGIFQYKHC